MHSLNTVFNGTNVKNAPTLRMQMNKNLMGMPDRLDALPDSLMSRVKKGYDKVKDYKESYENFGLSGLLGHYIQTTEPNSKFMFDGPGGKIKYNFPKGSAYIGPDKHGGAKIGLNYEF
jgi:hypothetical protein